MALRFVEPIYDYLNSLFSGLVAQIIIAIIIVLAGFVIGRIASRLLNLLLHAAGLDDGLKKVGLKFSLEATLSLLVAYAIYIAAILIALNSLNLTSIILWIIVAITVVLIVVATILGIRDFIPNFFAGLYVFRHGTIQVGDHIRVAGVEGKVIRISIIETELETKHKDHMIVPNSLLTKTIVVKKK